MYETVLALIVFLAGGTCQSLQNPCPEVFQYKMDNSNGLYGFVQVRNTGSSVLQLDVELSVGNYIGTDKGKISLANSYNIMSLNANSIIQYNIYFPRWEKIPPQVTKIVFNGNVICFGPKITFGVATIVTTVNLQHLLRIDIRQLSTDSQAPNVNIIQPQTSGPSETDFDMRPPPDFDRRPPPDFDRRPPPGHNRRPPGHDRGPPGHDRGPPGHDRGPPGHDRRPPPDFDRGPPPDYDRRPPPDHDRRPPPDFDRRPPPDFDDRREPPPRPPPNRRPSWDYEIDREPPARPRPTAADPDQSFPQNPFFTSNNQPGRFPQKTGGPSLYNSVFTRDKEGIYPGNPFFASGNVYKDVDTPILNKVEMRKDIARMFPGNPFFGSSSRGGNVFGGGDGSIWDTGIEPVLVSNEQPATPVTSPPIPVTPKLDIRPAEALGGGSLNEICGRPLAVNTLVYNGQTVPRGAFPWLAALFMIEASQGVNLSYKCSSSLISNKHVVTAAHCVKMDKRVINPRDLLIVLGKLNIKKWTGSDGENNVGAETIHVHPEYEPLSADADIAVIVLSDTVQFTKFIRPICLWSGSTNLATVEGNLGTVVGWGRDESGELVTAEPKQTSLPIVSQETCLRSFAGFQHITSNRTFCAGNLNGSGPCNGDSGSGFVMNINGVWTLRGIVSTSISDVHSRTCDLTKYVVFTDAGKFTQWLQNFIS